MKDFNLRAPVFDFIQKVKTLDDHDYGDFMRKANFYLILMQEEMSHEQAVLNEKKIEDIQLFLQFYPNWDVESTRQKVIQKATEMGPQLGAPFTIL